MESIILSKENHLATLTFNRPDKLNAFTRDMAYELEEICQELNADQTIRAVLLRGNGDAFMAGTDLYEVYRDLESIPAEALSTIRQFNACILLMREMEKTIIASVHGLVAGTGMSLLLATDLVVASDNAEFSFGATQIALSPAGASTYLLPRIVGTRRAMELLIMPETFSAEQAKLYGLVNWVVSPDLLQSKTQHVVDSVIHGPTVALTQTKQLLNSAWQNKLTTQLELEAEAMVKCANTRDFKTAIRAFINKVPAEFEGR